VDGARTDRRARCPRIRHRTAHRARPLWSATFITGLADRGTGLVIVMNHVLADGIGGLAVLARLVDEIAGLPPGNPERARFPVPAPRARALAADARVTQIAAMTRERKTAARGTSAAVLGPPFRLLAPTGLLRWFINRQQLIHTFATNPRGPAEPLTFAGAPVRAVIPIPNTTGNVTVAFGALSYTGTLRITILSDPSRMPDVTVLTAALRQELGSAAR
jgi:diacylglycerol O-acyltransferase / wax synthase